MCETTWEALKWWSLYRNKETSCDAIIALVQQQMKEDVSMCTQVMHLRDIQMPRLKKLHTNLNTRVFNVWCKSDGCNSSKHKENETINLQFIKENSVQKSESLTLWLVMIQVFGPQGCVDPDTVETFGEACNLHLQGCPNFLHVQVSPAFFDYI